jgi:formylglycine-generating enzyme required for sulfatase activity
MMRMPLFEVALVVLVGSMCRGAAPASTRPTTLPTYSLAIPGTTATYDFVRIPAGKVRVPPKSAAESDSRSGGIFSGWFRTPPKKSAEPDVIVSVPSIWMGKTEVTWDCFDVWAFSLDADRKERWQRVEAKSRPTPPYGSPDRGFGHEEHPAIGVHQEAIQLYCLWLSAKSGKKVRLPTEAEWVYACRAGADADVSDAKVLKEIAWYRDNADKMTAKVAKLRPNAFGLYDMLGNAAEFVQPLADGKWFVKGGSFRDKESALNSVSRNYYDPDWQARDPADPPSTWWLSDADFVGFRLVMEEPPKP